MINRTKMPRQLRNKGGITNVISRKKYGIGSDIKDFARKIIPNEIADVAVKIAPVVAMIPGYGPAAAGIMRGIGRFDQRGSISDALKQGALTYGGGKLFGAGMEKFGLRDPGASGIGEFFNEGTRNKAGSLFKSQEAANTAKTTEDARKGVGIIQKATDATIGKIPLLNKLPDMVQQQLLVGGITGGASALYSYFTGEFEPQQPGETMGEYMARRNQRVKQQMRGYMDSYYTPLRNPQYAAMSDEEKNNFIDGIVGEQNDAMMATGGRVGYQTGGISSANTLAENIRRNKANQAAVAKQFEQGRNVQKATQLLDQAVGPSGKIGGLTDLYNKYFYGRGNLGGLGFNQGTTSSTLGQYHSIAAKSRPQIIKDIAYQLGQQGGTTYTAAPKPRPKTYRTVSPEAQALNMSQSTYQDILSSGADPRQYYMDYQNRIMAGNPNLLKYGQVIGGPGMMMAGPGMGPGATPPTQAQVNQMMQNNPMGYMDFDDLVKIYSADPYKGLQEEIKDIVGGRDTGYMSAQDYYDINVLGLDGRGIAEKYGIAYASGGRVKFDEGADKKIQMIKDMLKRGADDDTIMTITGATQEEIDQIKNSKAKGGMPTGIMRSNKAGVMERDYRDEGGFVPVGIKEKADDVPAMLSKNEFVFTADAVRGAGNGSVEKGAQKMYDTMKNLERRVV